MSTTNAEEMPGASTHRSAPTGTRTMRVQVNSTDAVCSARSRSPAPSREAMSGTATAARMPPAATSNNTLGMALTVW